MNEITAHNGRHPASGSVRCAASIDLRTVATEFCSDGLYAISRNSPVRDPGKSSPVNIPSSFSVGVLHTTVFFFWFFRNDTKAAVLSVLLSKLYSFLKVQPYCSTQIINETTGLNNCCAMYVLVLLSVNTLEVDIINCSLSVWPCICHLPISIDNPIPLWTMISIDDAICCLTLSPGHLVVCACHAAPD